MPNHIHLLISEPERGTPSTVMQVVKQRFARRVLNALRDPTPSAGSGQALAEDARAGHPAALPFCRCRICGDARTSFGRMDSVLKRSQAHAVDAEFVAR